MNVNKGFSEIKDAEFLQELKEDFNKNYIHYGSMNPIICGTIVDKCHLQGTFDRKIKMIRAPLFSLLTVC